TAFGDGAFYAEAYLNTDDSAPASSDALEHAYNMDVTAARPEDLDEDRWHWWPIDAWLEDVRSRREGVALRAIEETLAAKGGHELRARGSVEVR
ncbi:MAG: hypothetical protein AAGI01_01295, partial [Myxococcota bacterium]